MTSRPVRVLLVAPCFGDYGGIEAFVLAVADGLLKDARFDVRICLKRTAEFAMRDSLARQCHSYPVELCSRASRSLRATIAWADVVHGQNASPDTAILARVLRKPLVLTIHNTLPLRPVARRVGCQVAASLAKVRWYNSHFVWKTWEPQQPKANSFCVPPTSRLPAAEVAAGARRGFVFLGRLVPGKGADVLLDAYRLAQLDPAIWPLTFLGDGPMRDSLSDRCVRERIAGVRFGGFVDGDVKAQALAGSRWLVAPSHWQEPFGLVAVEARSVGVPCIVTRDGGLPEAAGSEALVCEPHDINGLAGVLHKAAEMPEEEYAARSLRTQLALDVEMVPASFYREAFLRLVKTRQLMLSKESRAPSDSSRQVTVSGVGRRLGRAIGHK